VDSQALWIGGVVGVAVGGAAVNLWLRGKLREYADRVAELTERGEVAERHRRDAVDRSADLLTSVARMLGQISSDAEHTLTRLTQADEKVATGIDDLASGGEIDTATVSASVSVVEQASGEMTGRNRDLATVCGELERRTELVLQVLEGASGEGRMAEHKVDDLVAAAGESVGTASEMDNVIRKLQGSAAETAELSTQVSTEAERGYRAVHRTLDEIERIRTLVGLARARIDALGERVSDIGHVVRVIQDITEKTNLLALNASIIAAQAGEHGRSFAVVANEIKALAQRTAASTKEISEQIRSVQEESERATSAMVDGVAAVGEGFQVAIAAGDALDAIRQRARAAQKRVQQMTRILRQQNTAAVKVVDSAAAVSERATSFATAVRGQSSNAERLRSAAKDMRSDARQISSLLGQHSSNAASTSDVISAVVDQLSLINKRNRDLKRLMRSIHSESERSRNLGDDLAAHWSAVSEAAASLSERVDDLRAQS
jgi:methyl-accepting chemotaxis protein